MVDGVHGPVGEGASLVERGADCNSEIASSPRDFQARPSNCSKNALHGFHAWPLLGNSVSPGRGRTQKLHRKILGDSRAGLFVISDHFKTAKPFGRTIPSSLLARADQVIE